MIASKNNKINDDDNEQLQQGKMEQKQMLHTCICVWEMNIGSKKSIIKRKFVAHIYMYL